MDLFESTLTPITEDLRDPEAELPPLRTSSGWRWWTGGWPSGCCGRETCRWRSIEDFYFSKKRFWNRNGEERLFVALAKDNKVFLVKSPYARFVKFSKFWSKICYTLILKLSFLNIPIYHKRPHYFSNKGSITSNY